VVPVKLVSTFSTALTHGAGGRVVVVVVVEELVELDVDAVAVVDVVEVELEVVEVDVVVVEVVDEVVVNGFSVP